MGLGRPVLLVELPIPQAQTLLRNMTATQLSLLLLRQEKTPLFPRAQLEAVALLLVLASR